MCTKPRHFGPCLCYAGTDNLIKISEQKEGRTLAAGKQGQGRVPKFQVEMGSATPFASSAGGQHSLAETAKEQTDGEARGP